MGAGAAPGAARAAGAAAQAAIANTPAHDVKKHLTLLGVSGSELARRAASEQSDHPRTVLAQSSGTTLLRAALGIPVEPSHLASTWISEDQRQVLDELIDGIDAELEDRGPQPSIEVLEIEGTRIHLLYRGRRIDLANPAPTLEAALDPVSLSLLVGAGWKLLNALDPGCACRCATCCRAWPSTSASPRPASVLVVGAIPGASRLR